MKTEILKLDIPQTAMLWRCINSAVMLKLISSYGKNFKRRARAAFRRNLANPGDCQNDLPMLAALAVAEAEIGRHAGWIPEVQRIACAIVSKPGF